MAKMPIWKRECQPKSQWHGAQSLLTSAFRGRGARRPKNLEELLKRPEWKGSNVEGPALEFIDGEEVMVYTVKHPAGGYARIRQMVGQELKTWRENKAREASRILAEERKALAAKREAENKTREAENFRTRQLTEARVRVRELDNRISSLKRDLENAELARKIAGETLAKWEADLAPQPSAA